MAEYDQNRAALRDERIALRRKQVAVANLLLEQAEKRARRLQENYDQWGWLGGYEDVIDRIRQPGKELYAPMSTVNDRRHGHNWPFWRTWAEHARLRASARLLCTLSPIATGALCGLRAYVIGEGYTYRAATNQLAPRALVAAVQAVVDEFVEDVGWCALEQEAFFRSRRDGEFFLLHEPQSHGRLSVEILEPEQIQAPPGEGEEEWSYGIQTRGRKTHVPLRYHVVEDVAVPGDFYSPDELHHLKVNVDAKVKRGLSDFSYDTHDAVRTAGRVVDHVGQGAAVQASIAMIRQHATASPDQVQDFITAASDYDRYDPISGQTEYSERFHPGKIVDIDAGQEYVVPPFASNVSGYIEVIQAILRSVAVRWNAPEWILSADASSTNYASSVTAESPFVKRCYQEQEFYKSFFLRTIRRAVRLAAKAGRIRAHGRTWSPEEVETLVQVSAEAPNVEVRDDFRTAQVDQIYMNMGVKSPKLIQQELGIDSDQVQADLGGGQTQQTPGQPPQQQGNPDDPTAALRGSVGGSQALLQLQQAYYQGTLPRDACIANARIVYGFTEVDAEALFPERKPDAPGVQEQQQGGAGGGGLAGMLGGMDASPDESGDTGPAQLAQPAPEDDANPLDSVLFGDEPDANDETPPAGPGSGLAGPLAESRRLREREGSPDKLGRRRCYDDTTGKLTKCPPKEGEPVKKGRKKKTDDQQQQPAGQEKKPAARKRAVELDRSMDRDELESRHQELQRAAAASKPDAEPWRLGILKAVSGRDNTWDGSGPVEMDELYRDLKKEHPGLTMDQFHATLYAMIQDGTIRPVPYTGAMIRIQHRDDAMPYGREIITSVLPTDSTDDALERAHQQAKKPAVRKAAPKQDKTSSPEKVQAALDALHAAQGDPERIVAALTQHNHATVKELAKLLGEKTHGGTLAMAQRLAQAAGSKPQAEKPAQKQPARKPPIAFGPEDLGDPEDLIGDDNPARKRKTIGDQVDDREARVQAHAERVAREEGGQAEEDDTPEPQPKPKRPASKKSAGTSNPAGQVLDLYGRYSDKNVTIQHIDDAIKELEAANLPRAELEALARQLGINRPLRNKAEYLKAIRLAVVGRKGAWDRVDA